MDREKLEKYKEIEDKVKEFVSILSAKKEVFENSLKIEKEAKKALEEDLAKLKEEITVEAKAEFKENKVKKLLGGVGITENTSYAYDKKDALKWSKEKDLFLKLDESAFNTFVKTTELDFVVKTENIIKVSFPTKGIKLEG